MDGAVGAGAGAGGVNPDTITNGASDAVLALACGWLVLRPGHRPGLAVAALLIGLAATLGTLRFAGLEVLAGPHRFASLVSACAAFPLLALALRWPDDPFAARLAGATRLALLLGGIGAGLTVAGVSQWGPVVAALSALAILATMVAARDAAGIAGGLLLVVGMGATIVGAAMGFNATPVLHLCLAAGLLALAHAAAGQFKPRSIAQAHPPG